MFEILRRSREKFLLLEVAPKRTSGVLVGIDKEKNILPERFWDNFYFEKSAPNPLKGLRKKEVVVAVDPAFAATASAPFFAARENEEIMRPLALLELESLFQRELARIAENYKGKVGARLGLEANDIVLVDAKASGFRVDGHLVMNPVGFRAKNIEAVMELTFTSRRIFDDLREFFKAKEGFFFTTLPKASAFALSRVEPPPFNFLLLRPNESRVFILEKTDWGENIREIRIQWRMDAFLETVAKMLGVSPSAVFGIYDRYTRKSASESFLRHLDRALFPLLKELQEKLKGMDLRGRIYVFSPLPMPLPYPIRYGRISFEGPPLYPVLERFGFKLRLDDWPAEESETFLRLAPFLEAYFGKSDSEINRSLRRRLHWLIG